MGGVQARGLGPDAGPLVERGEGDVASADIEGALAPFDLKNQLSSNRTQGIPNMIALIRDVVVGLRATGVATVLVEQRVSAVLGMADRVAFMDQGHVAEVLDCAGLQADAPQFRQYVGV